MGPLEEDLRSQSPSIPPILSAPVVKRILSRTLSSFPVPQKTALQKATVITSVAASLVERKMSHGFAMTTSPQMSSSYAQTASVLEVETLLGVERILSNATCAQEDAIETLDVAVFLLM